MLPFLVSKVSCDAAYRKQLKAKYASHTAFSYKNARIQMYNNIDCKNNKMHLLYGGNEITWKCGGTSVPDSKIVNAEHVVPQSLFNSKTPMVSDLHHLFSSPAKLNNRRSNYKFGEFANSNCKYWCKDNECSTSTPSNPDEYSCLSNSNVWKPRNADKGEVARAVLYFFTMYDDQSFDISSVGDVKTFVSWANQYPPTSREKERNTLVNKIQGNSNPYIEDNANVNKAWA